MVFYGERPDYEIVGAASDDKGNTYKILFSDGAASPMPLSTESEITALVEYQIALNDASEFQVPATVSFWFACGIKPEYEYLRTDTSSRFSVVDCPIDKIQ